MSLPVLWEMSGESEKPVFSFAEFCTILSEAPFEIVDILRSFTIWSQMS